MLSTWSGRDARAVILDGHLQARTALAALGHRPRTQQDPVIGPLEGVLQQVAEDLQQVAGLAVEARTRIDIELAQHVARGVHLLQAAHQVLGMRLDLDRGDEGLHAGGRRARELVGDDVVHALHLLGQFLACIVGHVAQLQARAHHRQRRLQAVRQVGQDVAVAGQAAALVLDEIVEAAGQARTVRSGTRPRAGRARRDRRAPGPGPRGAAETGSSAAGTAAAAAAAGPARPAR